MCRPKLASSFDKSGDIVIYKIIGAFAVAVVVGSALPVQAAEITANIPESAIAKFNSRAQSKYITDSTSFVVVDTKSGEVVASKSPLRGMVPASTMKVITATVALESLGESFRFKTHARWNKSTKTLYLIGSGDPLLRSAQLRELAHKVAGAIKVSGKIKVKVDSSLYPSFTMPQGWAKSQLPGNARPVSALVVDDRNTMHPARDAGEKFAQYVRAAGIKNTFAGEGSASGADIAKVTSLPLTVAIRQMLHQSNNDIAEMLFRDSAIYSDKAGTWESARSHAHATISGLGIKMDNIALVDGSGLSRANRINASALAQVLGLALDPQHTHLAPLATKDLLATAGTEGTLTGRFKFGRTACAKGLVEGKTGSLRDVISLTGYAHNANGGLAAFSVIVNKIPRRSMQTSVRNSIDWMITALVGCTSA